MKIDKNTTIASLLHQYPQTMDILSRFGLHASTDNDKEHRTLEQASLDHALNMEELMSELYKRIDLK